MQTGRQSGVFSQRMRYIVRLICQGLLTLLLVVFDLVKSASGGEIPHQ